MTNCEHNIVFKGVNSISQDLLLNILEANFKMYLDWAFLNIGGWFDASINTSTLYGINQHSKLLPVHDPSYQDGRVWQGIRKDWVWETDITFNSSSPLPISSVVVGSNTINKSDNFSINYPLGRIIFNTPINIASNVNLNYSYRFVQTHRSSESPWFNVLQYSSLNTSNADIKLNDDGEWSIGGHHRIKSYWNFKLPLPQVGTIFFKHSVRVL